MLWTVACYADSFISAGSAFMSWLQQPTYAKLSIPQLLIFESFFFFFFTVIVTDEWKIMSDKLSEANSVKCEAQVCIGMRIMNKFKCG